MSFFGIVPRVSMFVLPYALLALYLNFRFRVWFGLPVLGYIMLFLGLVLWLVCYSQVSKAYRERKLLTTGCYSRVRHPIYSIWGFLVIPGFSFIIGGFMLGLPVVYWLFMLKFIGDEERELEEMFGEEWRKYARRTGRFLP
ncbi:methyltransferase family protein [Pyrococcus kukulkanii]|uniref:methyltransferase family protein n=1 Tax=Pyrococcus kukulkanii TaxID=1609559 RepID=UPI003563FE16